MRSALLCAFVALAGCTTGTGHYVSITLDDVPATATRMLVWVALGNDAAAPVRYTVHTTDTTQSLVLELPKNGRWASATFVAQDDDGCDLAIGTGGIPNSFTAKTLLAELPMFAESGTDCGVDHTAGMIRFAATTYTVGCNSNDPNCQSDEEPVQEVALPAFELDAVEVTMGAYADCVTDGACTAPVSDDVLGDGPYDAQSGLTWADADAFCTWRGKQLPSEAQWEGAMRGPEARRFPWGGDLPTCDYANYATSTTTTCRSVPGLLTEQLLSLGTTPTGLWDGGGNVAEWVADWYAPRSQLDSADLVAHGSTTGTERVTKGGAWATQSAALRGSSRLAFLPDGTSSGTDDTAILGTRCGK